MTERVWLNGRIVPEAEARVSIWDRGFLYGDGVFEVMRVCGGRPLHLDAHLTRLAHGLRRLEFACAPPAEELRGAVDAVLGDSAAPDGVLRITVTRGESPGGWRAEAAGPPTRVVAYRPGPPPPESWYGAGVSAVWCDVPMMDAAWWPSDVKHCNWLPRILAKPQVDAADAAEGFLRTRRGTLAEGLTSNVFVVRDDRVRTPPLFEGVLPGVTRAWVLLTAERLGIAAAEAEISVDAVARAAEVFFTNAGLGLVPVVTLDGRTIGTGVPGPVWRRLRDAYEDEARS